MSSEHDVARAIEVLRAGGLIALPTETVYGLGADAENPAAVARVFAAKGRPADHPLIVHLKSADVLSDWAADVDATGWTLARAFWPGPLTLVLHRTARIPTVTTGGLETVGLRVPAHPIALAVLRSFDGAIAAPSANRFGRLSPTTAEHVRCDLGNAVDFVLDGGACTVGVESTIVDLSEGEPAILRPGGVTREMLEAALGRPVGLRTAGGPRVPGTLESHYAPRAVVRIVSGAQLDAEARALVAAGERVGVLETTRAARTSLPPGVHRRALGTGGVQEVARSLYAALRALDDAGCTVILATLPADEGIGLAVGDRLRRAAGPREG